MSDEIGKTMFPLCMARSRANQLYFFLLLIVTGCVFIFFDLFFLRRVGIFTLIFAGVTITQALRTYVFRTVFTDDRIEHTTMFGFWHGLEYSKIMVSEDRGEAITIIGEDILGKGTRIRLQKRDGNFEEVLAFLRKKTSSQQGEFVTR